MASRTLVENRDAPFAKGAGLNMRGMLGYDNGITGVRRAKNAAGTGMVDVHGVDEYNRLLVGGYHIRPMRTPIVFTLATNASLVTQRFFIADMNYEIVGITESHATADGAANTAYITKEINGQAPGAGTAVMTNTFDMNGTANTVLAATLNARSNPGFFGNGEPTISVKRGEMLSFKIASAVTSLAGVQITLYVLPQAALNPAVFTMKANAAILTQSFYLSNTYQTVSGVQAVWDTNASGAGTITFDVTKDTSTNAPGAGSSILAAAVNVNSTATANTVVTPALHATASRAVMTPGDRLAVKMAGTLTALAGLVIVVSFANGTSSTIVPAPAGVVTVQYGLLSNTNLGVATSFFTAERNYEVSDLSFTWSVAATTYTLGVTVDTGTTAPGAGTAVNTAVDASTTANTVGVATLSVSRRVLTLPAGARLSIAYPTATTKGSLAGLMAAVSLIPR